MKQNEDPHSLTLRFYFFLYIIFYLNRIGDIKSNNHSAKKSTPIHNNINNAKDFGKYFILEKRKISQSEFNYVSKKISEINPSLMPNSLSASGNSDGNFIFNEPNLNEFFSVNQIK